MVALALTSSVGQVQPNPSIAVLQAFQDANRLDARELPYTRWLSLYHVPPERLEHEKRLLGIVANSLSVRKQIAIPWPVPNTNDRLYRVDLRWYDWPASAWEKMGQFQPYFRDLTLQPAIDTWAFLKQATYSQWPVQRADYFAYRATMDDVPNNNRVEGFYQDFLALGQTDKEFYARLGIVAPYEQHAHPAQVAGIQLREEGEDGPTNYNRRLVRFPSGSAINGYLWVSLDTQSNAGKENVLQNLFDDLKIAAREEIAKLPNGGQVYGIFNAAGKRVAFGDPLVAHDKHFRDKIVWTGRSCISCHAEGIRPFQNDLTKLIRSKKFDVQFGSLRKLQIALDLYADDDALEAAIENDGASYNRFTESAGGMKSGEFAAAYRAGWKRYWDQPVTLEVAARELGMSARECGALLGASGDATLLALQAGQPMGRDAWEGVGDKGAFSQAMRLKIYLDARGEYLRKLNEPLETE